MPLETAAIVVATAPEVRASRATLMFRMFHQLTSDEARMLLFEDYRFEGQSYALIDAAAAGATAVSSGRAERMRAARSKTAIIRDHAETMAQALAAVIQEVMGKKASPMVASAWSGALAAMLRSCAGSEEA